MSALVKLPSHLLDRWVLTHFSLGLNACNRQQTQAPVSFLVLLWSPPLLRPGAWRQNTYPYSPVISSSVFMRWSPTINMWFFARKNWARWSIIKYGIVIPSADLRFFRVDSWHHLGDSILLDAPKTIWGDLLVIHKPSKFLLLLSPGTLLSSAHLMRIDNGWTSNRLSSPHWCPSWCIPSRWAVQPAMAVPTFCFRHLPLSAEWSYWWGSTCSPSKTCSSLASNSLLWESWPNLSHKFNSSWFRHSTLSPFTSTRNAS